MSSKVNTEGNIGELAVAVLFLCILALLTTNILIFEVAAKHNDDVCRSVTIAAAKAAVDGKDTASVKNIALDEIMHFGFGGFFITAPKLIAFTDKTQDDTRRLTIQTQCMVNLPVRRLIMTDDMIGILTLKRSYVAEIGVKHDADPKKSGSK